jgi:hypothetical protein
MHVGSIKWLQLEGFVDCHKLFYGDPTSIQFGERDLRLMPIGAARGRLWPLSIWQLRTEGVAAYQGSDGLMHVLVQMLPNVSGEDDNWVYGWHANELAPRPCPSGLAIASTSAPGH